MPSQIWPAHNVVFIFGSDVRKNTKVVMHAVYMTLMFLPL
jgi:hypothetical protein